MFATLNLQITSTITTVEPSAETIPTISTPERGREGGLLPFSQLLGMRTDVGLDVDATSGQILPRSGKPLPPLQTPQGLEGLEAPMKLGDPASAAVTIDPKLRNEVDHELELEQEMELEIDFAYRTEDVTVVDAPHVTLLSMQIIPGAKTQSLPLKPLEVKPETLGRLGTDTPSNSRPIQTLATEVGIALAAQTQNLVAPTGGETTVLPNAEGVVRDRILQATRQSPVPVAVVAQNTIESTHENLLVPLGRTVGVVASVERPAFRVEGPSTTQASPSAHLSPAISPFASDTGLNRQEPSLQVINTPVRDAAWGQKLGEQLITLTGNQVRTAEIKLTPADLGPLRVQISIEEGAANVAFHAQHSVTREAIEQALPKLREMMAESGLSLGQTDVSEQGVSGGTEEREFGSASNADKLVDEPVEADIQERRKTVTSNNLLDTFV